MRKMKFGILLLFAIIALVSVASAALPSQITATVNSPGPSSYWDVDITVGGGDIIAANDYIGHCSDTGSLIWAGSHVFQVYSSLGSLPSGIPTMNWNKANYIINHKGGADMYTVQAAIWHYDGSPHVWGPVNIADYNALVAAADAHPAYVPGPGEKYAVILYNPGLGEQPIFIELPVPTIPSPEFPTLAFPVALMIGVVGVVQYIKIRKE